MSYEIERGKRVLWLPGATMPDGKRECGALLYVHAVASNNCTPHIFDWHTLAVEATYEENGQRVWGGNVLVPERIWTMAAYADGGGIKPNSRDVAGIKYLQDWKAAAQERKSILDADGNLLWYPRVEMWTGDKDKRAVVNTTGVDAFKGYRKLECHDAFHRLFPEPLDRDWTSRRIATLDQLRDAILLKRNREDLPLGLDITSEARDPFFTA